MRSIIINSKLGEIEGYANEKIVYFDRYDTKAGKDIRHFILLDEHIKLMYEPWGWKDEWYAELINIEYIIDNNSIKISDLYVDIIIEGNGPTYRLSGIVDIANALVNKEIEAKELSKSFKKLQEFLDTYLHKECDFPPANIRSFIV